MSSNTRIGAAVVAVVVLGGAIYLLGSRGEGGSMASTAAPTSVQTGSAPVATVLPSDIVLTPPSPLPDPIGAVLPGDLIGRRYAQNPPTTLDGKELLLTLRAADDPHCMAMYGGRSTCFTVLWSPIKSGDPGARGPARIVDGKLVLGFALVPYDEGCVGSEATYAYEDAGQTLRGIDTPRCTFPGFRQLGATSAAAVPFVFDTRTISSDFALPMQLTMPSGWKPLHGIVGVLGVLHTGYPEGPDSTWWGPEFLLVEEAQIHDPSDVVSSEPVAPDLSRYVPWPTDLFAYITALPGVTVVSGPEPITVGGVTGTQMVVMTPPLRPLVWMKGDHSPLGGGEPAMERRFILLKTGGHTLFLDFMEQPANFDARYAEFRAILDSISFE